LEQQIQTVAGCITGMVMSSLEKNTSSLEKKQKQRAVGNGKKQHSS